MAGQSHRVSKKTIIAIIMIIALLLVTGISVGIFLADKGKTEAVDGSTTEQIENNDNKDQTTNPENKEEDSNTTTNSSNTTENNQTGKNDVTENGENPNNNTNGNNTTNRRNNNVTTGTNVDEIGETTVTRIEEEEKLISKNYWDWWTAMPVVVGSTTAKINATLPKVEINKEVITKTGESNLTYAGQELIYRITVKNTGDKELKNIEITDKIPTNTTFVAINEAPVEDTTATINRANTVVEEDEVKGVKWIATIPVGETLKIEFTVKVDENVTGTISNIAIANGNESNETKTAIIKAEKSSAIINDAKSTNKQKEIAKVGDKILYTITVENTGEVDGITTITDNVPDGTKLVSTEGAEISNDNKTVTWKNINVPAQSKITKKFIVEVISIDGTIKNIATVGGKDTNEDERQTADIKVVKEVVGIKRDKENLELDAKVQAGDVIEYKITVTNTGSADLTNVILDEKLVGIDIDAEKLQIGDLAAGESREISAKYTVTYEKDIKEKADRTIINNVEVTGETTPQPGKETEKVTDKDQTTTPVEEMQKVDVVKATTQTETVKAGDIVNYTIKVKNTGNVTLTNVSVTDKITLAAGEETLDIYSDAEYKNEVTEIAKLEVGEEVTLYAKYEVTQADIDAQKQITNVATAGTTPSNPVPVTPEKSNPSMSVVKKADKTTVKAGDTVNYTITVTNTGNVTLTNVSVTDKITLATGEETLDIYSDAEYKNKVTEIAQLKVGEEVTLYAKYDVTQADIDAQQTIVNVATAGTTPSDPVPVTPENKFGYRVEYYYENDEQDVQGAVTVDGKVFVLNETIYSREDVTFGDIITDYDDKTITGYEFYKVTPTNTADPTKSALVITANEENNVIKVYYVKKTYTYKVEHYIQNLDGTWPNEPKDTDTINNVKYGDIAGYEENSYTGFTFDDTLTKPENGIKDVNGNITVPDNNNLVIKLYYTRNKYQYVVNYLKLGTAEVLHEQKVESDIPFGTVITSSNEIIDIKGYNYHHVNPDNITIATEGNVINIYYTENIRTAQIVEKSTTIRKTNLVLVLDLSSSMEDGTTRLRDAKTAANKFIDQIYNNKDISGINIKVVTFNTRNPILEGVTECSNEDHYERFGFGWGRHKSNGDSDEYDGCVRINGSWYSETKTADYSGTQVLPTTLDNNTATNYQEAQKLKDAISNIYIPEQYKKGGYGTHIYAALQEANTQINNLKQEYANNDNVVVFLGDGKPTETSYSEYGDNSIANIKSAARTLKNNAVVYCIRLGNEAQKSTVFGDIATSSDKIIDANTQGELIAGFDAITSKENTRNDTANSSNGIITIEADLDTTKPIEVTKPDGTTATYNSVEELNASGFISYNTANKTFTWNVLNYPNNITLNISYSVN